MVSASQGTHSLEAEKEPSASSENADDRCADGDDVSKVLQWQPRERAICPDPHWTWRSGQRGKD